MIDYKHKYIPNVTYEFYNNSDDLETNANFASWQMHIVHADDFIVVSSDVCDLIKDGDASYRFYGSFVFPDLPNGCYRYVIIDTADSDQVLYISDEFEVVQTTEGLSYVSFRNAVNAYNFNYTGITDFENRFHVELFTRKPLNNETVQGYSLVSGLYKPVRTTFGKTLEFVTGWFDEKEHDAMQAMTRHSDLQIEINNKLRSLTRSNDQEYLPEWSENYELIQTTVRMTQDDTNETFKGL